MTKPIKTAARENKRIQGSIILRCDLHHSPHTTIVYRPLYQPPSTEQEHGFRLMDLLPMVKPSHNLLIKVTVEVLNPGKVCPVQYIGDGLVCTRASDN